VRRGNIHVPSLYNGRPRGLYWFTSGVHIPGVVAWCVGVSLGLPGLIGSSEPTLVGQSAKNMYRIGWILYASAAAATYYVTVTFVEKPAMFLESHRHLPFAWEFLAKTQHEGSFGDEVLRSGSAEGLEIII
jgi:nucleobase:cation symporter-1, NCS1 family